MCLSSKAGAHNKVLHELLKLNIPRGDIFLLFGPIDILVQFKVLESLDDFLENWFTPVRMNCCKDNFHENNDFCSGKRVNFICGGTLRIYFLECEATAVRKRVESAYDCA